MFVYLSVISLFVCLFICYFSVCLSFSVCLFFPSDILVSPLPCGEVLSVRTLVLIASGHVLIKLWFSLEIVEEFGRGV